MANFMLSPDFMEFITHGIFPGGAGVAWTSCTIVNLLRDAEDALAEDGMGCQLAKAIEETSPNVSRHTRRSAMAVQAGDRFCMNPHCSTFAASKPNKGQRKRLGIAVVKHGNHIPIE